MEEEDEKDKPAMWNPERKKEQEKGKPEGVGECVALYEESRKMVLI